MGRLVDSECQCEICEAEREALRREGERRLFGKLIGCVSDGPDGRARMRDYLRRFLEHLDSQEGRSPPGGLTPPPGG